MVLIAILITTGIVVCVTVHAYTTSNDYTAWAPFFMSLIVGAILSIVFFAIFNVSFGRIVICAIGAILFTVFLAVDL